jgi:hypothetical protein
VNIFFCFVGVSQAQQDRGWYRTTNLADCNGPADSSGLQWYMPAYNDSSWLQASLPESNWGCNNCDRYHRRWLIAGPDSTIFLALSSDDGLWLYIDGEYIGHWGGDCHQGGTVSGYVLIYRRFCMMKRYWWQYMYLKEQEVVASMPQLHIPMAELPAKLPKKD